MKHFSREKYDKYNKSISSKKSIQIVYYLCLIGIFSCLLLLFSVKTFVNREVNALKYKESSDVDYRVKLKPNEYYETDNLPSGMVYIASLIDSIDLRFNYTFTTNSNIDYNASYYIEAITRVYGKDNKNILYEKSEILVPEEKISKKNIMANNFFKEVNVNYEHFNAFVKAFKASYSLNYDSDVTIVLHVNSHGTSSSFNDDIDSEGLSLVVIPLTEQTINITIDSKNINNSGSVIDDNIWNNINYIYFSCLVISLIGDLYVIYKLIRLIIKIYKSRSNYDKTLRKILKEYDSIITNAENILDESDYKVLNLSSFDELRDAHDNLGSPIIYNELIPGKLSYFSIIDDNLLYKYTLDAKNLKEKWRQK